MRGAGLNGKHTHRPVLHVIAAVRNACGIAADDVTELAGNTISS
jgi:hypothetical protein